MTFDAVFSVGGWEAIRNCPGRFVLRGRPPTFSVQELLGCEPALQYVQSSHARDRVVIVRLDDGGLISYQRADGTFVHTLNTRDGFERKLAQLGIAAPPHSLRESPMQGA